MAFTLKRVYEPAESSDGFRVLVDRLWPRGISKEHAALDLWDKDLAPSPGLRAEWHHATDREGTFDAFAARYRAELDDNPATGGLLALGREHDRVTLLYGLRDEHRNHVVVLLEWLRAHGAEVESVG
ncbi:DUF488 family protein [Agromyces intestinalis]|uniref:DUF488 family protein n=1 Tax=Agromyces intestinalis TaxID=2592652 RepID=A0A5C1YEB1_9MICO|nr:DUF488 family protein [Agromyces intestinalis]QEO13347.1 DUF488 family protein [Agromyces intestinalis]